MLDAPPWEPEPAPDPARLMIDTVCERVTQSAGIVRAGKNAADAPQQVVDQVQRLARSFGALVGGNPLAPRLSLNSSVGPKRRLELVRVPLDIAKAVRNAFGCTINDVVLAAVGGALARLLEARGELHPELVVKVVCPVSVRDDSERMKLGNRLSLMFVPIPVGERDPCARLDAVSLEHCRPEGSRAGARARRPSSTSRSTRRPTILGLAAPRSARATSREPDGHQRARPAGAALLPRRARCTRSTRSSRSPRT